LRGSRGMRRAAFPGGSPGDTALPWECTPHFLLSCQKKMRRARWKRKGALRPNFGLWPHWGMRYGGFGPVKICWNYDASRFGPWGNHRPGAFKDALSFYFRLRCPGVLGEQRADMACAPNGVNPPLRPPSPGGVIQNRGPRPPGLVVSRGGLEGEIEIPLQRLFWTGRGPFSPRGENGGRIPAAKPQAPVRPGGAGRSYSDDEWGPRSHGPMCSTAIQT
jgi:hypothetical protein